MDDMYIGESAEEYSRRKEWEKIRWRGWEYSDAPEHPHLKNPCPDFFFLVEIKKYATPDGPMVKRLLPKEGEWVKGDIYRYSNEVLIRRWFVENSSFDGVVFCSDSGHISVEY